jgi:hypothetical protein
MAAPSGKINLWTEGLDEGWNLDSNQMDRLDRGIQSILEIKDHVDMLFFRYGDELDCRLILRHKENNIHLRLANEIVEASDPDNQNYQNITINQEKVFQFLEEFVYEEEVVEEDRLNIRTDKKGIAAMVGAVVVLAVAFFMAGFYGKTEEGFIPIPVAVEIKDPKEIQQFMQSHAGIYATDIEDGEMVIEISRDGHWGYFDIVKRSAQHYGAVLVSGGSFTPGVEGATLAIVTDKRYVFYPNGGEKLEFLERHFTKVARTRDDLAYLHLPSMLEATN